MQSWTRVFIIFIFVGILGGILTFHLLSSGESQKTNLKGGFSQSKEPPKVLSKISSQTTQKPLSKSSGSLLHLRQLAWKDFQANYGHDLIGDFTADGRVASIQDGSFRAVSPPDFKKGDRDSALAQAKKVLQDGEALLGINSEFSLEAKDVRSDEISSQIEFTQSQNGVPFVPHGKVTVQLESEGGLRALYSDYISNISLTNQKTLTSDEALSRLSDSLGSLMTESVKGELVIFVPGPQASAAPVSAQYGYRFWIRGREIIASASDGTILFQRDRRQF